MALVDSAATYWRRDHPFQLRNWPVETERCVTYGSDTWERGQAHAVAVNAAPLCLMHQRCVQSLGTFTLAKPPGVGFMRHHGGKHRRVFVASLPPPDKQRSPVSEALNPAINPASHGMAPVRRADGIFSTQQPSAQPTKEGLLPKS